MVIYQLPAKGLALMTGSNRAQLVIGAMEKYPFRRPPLWACEWFRVSALRTLPVSYSLSAAE